MNTNTSRWPLIAALAVALILGLVFWLLGPWNSQAAASELAGKTWQLTAINGQAPVPGSQVSLVFENDRLSGNASVNQYGGSYKVNGSIITVSNIISTLMASADPKLNQQEQDFLNILQNQLSYTLNGNQLELKSATGTLTFKS